MTPLDKALGDAKRNKLFAELTVVLTQTACVLACCSIAAVTHLPLGLLGALPAFLIGIWYSRKAIMTARGVNDGD